MLKTNTNITQTRSTINVQDTETILLEVDVAKYHTLEVQIVNNGGATFNQLKLYSRIHNEAPWTELELGNFQDTNSLLLDFHVANLNNIEPLPKPDELTSGDHCTLILNCTGKKEYRLTGRCENISYPVYVYYYVE
jgi:hypothetical protein